MVVKLRDYQEECHDAILAAWGESPWCDLSGTEETNGKGPYRSLIANLGTSAGKTIIAGAVIRSVRDRGKCLFIADTDELCAQPLESFSVNLGIRAGLEKAGSRTSILADVVVGSAQTMIRENRLERFDPAHFKYIFVDEAHRGSDRNKKITDYFSSAKLCGITATAFRAKTKDLSQWYEHVAYEMGLLDLMEEGYIVPIKVLTLPVKVDISDVHQTMGTEGMDYDRHEVSSKIEPFYEAIADMILEHARDRQLLVFNPLIVSSQKFAQICHDKGIKARHIDGQSPDRQAILEGFRQKRFQVLTNSQLLGTGWDCPPCDALLNLSVTRHEGTFRQRVGRILRTLPGVIDGIDEKDERKARIAASAKPDALVLDLLFQTDRFSLSGPVDLIAGNAEEREAIQRKLNMGELRDLAQVSKEVQEERERTLKEALERASKKRELLGVRYIDANYIGIALHSRTLTDYEPTSQWHELPATEKQLALLQKHGINPTTVKDRGHASKLTDHIFIRNRQKLCGIRAMVALEKKGVENASRFSEMQAYGALGKEMPFPFGRPAAGNQTFAEVPGSYWRWLSEQAWVEHSYPAVWAEMRERGLVSSQPFQVAQKTTSKPLIPLHFNQGDDDDDEIPF